MGAFAWVTLATNDSYSLGALVLAHSLKQAGTAHQLAVLVTPGVTKAMREKLASVFTVVQEVNILDSRDEANLRLLKRPELGITFTKLHCWRLTQFEKCVFLDADTLVLQNSDELFEREELSAAPDVGWPDCFNSGVFVYRPSLDTYEKLIQFALEKGSFDGGDQGLLNLYFSDWAHKDISKHLPFIYNMCSTACYSYLPAFKQFGANAKIIHFIGPQKPWLQYFNTETKKVQPSGDSSHLQDVLQRWWDIFCSLIHPHLSPAMQGQSQHGISPSYFPPQYDPPPNPTASADDYENTWDPWDEYDQKVAQNIHFTSISTHLNQNQPIESLNTNASRVADQPSIHHSQPQSHNYNTYSIQNNSYYQPPPPQAVYIPRVPTPPPTPQPEHYNQPPQFQHHHSDPPNDYSKPQHQHHELHYHVEPQYHQEHNNHQLHNQSHIDDQQHNENREPTYNFTEQSVHKDEHIHTYESLSHIPERPRSPDYPEPITMLPKECEATTTVSNDMYLISTIEDSSKQDDAGLAGAFAQLTLGVARSPEQDALETVLRKQAWEVGNIDYLGKDSFENIWSKISETLSSTAPVQPEVEAPAPKTEVPSAPVPISPSKAPQEEAISVQLPVSPVDTPKVGSLESSPLAEAQKEVQQAPTEVEPTATNVQVPAKEVVTSIESKPEVSEVLPAAEPLACPIPLKKVIREETKALDLEPQLDSPKSSLETASVPSPKVPQIGSQKSESPVTPLTADVTSVPVSPSAIATPAKATPKAPEPSGKPAAATPELDISTAVSLSAPTKDSPKTKVTEATPPVTPGTPPVEKAKQALAAETTVPDTPPPSEGGSTPTPPPRKTDKPKKAAAKPKK